MALTNCNKKLAIVYASVTGNTEAAAMLLKSALQEKPIEVAMWRVEEFPLAELSSCDAVLVGTYTWGSGEIPKEMRELFCSFEQLGRKELVTAAFGTGDSFFAEFCGAVDRFRDMLFVHTRLAATLKIELAPQAEDVPRCEKLAACVAARLT
ncbi:flavodoxin domain-containing protein [Planococcus sp. YIM B11945]|uniref:flavodoxin domain-containing protein n=1 Tax=Planococcus sp. YIM B11945 TaxID=3435410 RepID=UPI003D7CACBD